MSLLWKPSLSPMTFSGEPSHCHSSPQAGKPDWLGQASNSWRQTRPTQTLYCEAIICNWIAGHHPNLVMDSVENVLRHLSRQKSSFCTSVFSHFTQTVTFPTKLSHTNKQSNFILDFPTLSCLMDLTGTCRVHSTRNSSHIHSG